MNLVDAMRNMFDGLVTSKHWIAGVTVLLTLYSLFFATPAVHYAGEAFENLGWQVVERQIASDFIYQPGDDLPAVNQATKKTFRIAVPLIAKVLHLNPYGIYALQFLLGILFIALVLRFVYRETNDRVVAVLFATAFVSLFVGRACFTDIYSRFEGWAYLFVFLTIYFRAWWAVFLFALLACWTDERTIVGLAFAGMWWLYKEHMLERLSFANVRALVTKRYIAIGAAVVAYLAARAYLQFGLGYYTPSDGVGLHFVMRDFEFINFGLVTFLEGVWLLVFYKTYLLYREGRRGFLALNLLLLGAACFSAFIVFDITKSGSYIFLDAFLALAIIQNVAGLVTVRHLLRYAAGISVLFPPYYIIADLNPFILQQKSIVILLAQFLVQRYDL